ncbi:hypothetical protein LWI29_000137 [Acer saccharum]|uniref:Uncharacterized protein n=2 Tax=Acer saccharum TaxID=4024 RepID=A0AA39SB46_ACESA|nr:hypothetical protein LWI29_000137 [Acer saccharum]
MSCSRAEHTTEYLKPTQLFRETMKRTYYMPSAALTLDCVPVSPHIYHRSTKCRTFFTQILNRAEHQIQYLKPSQLFREVMKRDFYHYPAFIGLSFTEEYVRVAISDKLFAWIHGEFPRDDTILDMLVDAVQSIRNSSFCLAPSGSLFWRKAIYSERREGLLLFSAEHMLQSFLDCFWALYMDEYQEWEDKDEEREYKELKMEDKDLEMVDSKRKMIEYMKPLQFFWETIVSNYDNPVLPMILGLSFTDVNVVVGCSSYYMDAYPNWYAYTSN